MDRVFPASPKATEASLADRFAARTAPSKVVADSPGRRHGTLRVLTSAAVVAAALGMAVVLTHDGEWTWRIVRVAVLFAFVGAVVAVGSRRMGLAGAWAIVFGIVATALGLAIAAPWFDAHGLSMMSAGAGLAVIGGIASIVLGVATVWGSVDGVARAATLVIVLLAVYALGWPITIAVVATNVPRRTVGSETPAQRGLDYVDAAMMTADGVMLSGWYVPSSNGAAVVVLHGASSTRSNVLDQGEVLARHGYGVLMIDARGTGHSEGRAMNFGWYGDLDTRAAVDYLTQRADVDPRRIGALGESMGGEEALGALAADPRLRAVVAEGATNRRAADRKGLSDAYGVRGQLQELLDVPAYALTDLLTDASPPTPLRAAVNQAQRPVLLLAAGKVSDEQRGIRSIRAGRPDQVQVWIIDGAGHTQGLRTAPQQWESKVTAFFDQTLSG